MDTRTNLAQLRAVTNEVNPDVYSIVPVKTIKQLLRCAATYKSGEIEGITIRNGVPLVSVITDEGEIFSVRADECDKYNLPNGVCPISESNNDFLFGSLIKTNKKEEK